MSHDKVCVSPEPFQGPKRGISLGEDMKQYEQHDRYIWSENKTFVYNLHSHHMWSQIFLSEMEFPRVNRLLSSKNYSLTALYGVSATESLYHRSQHKIHSSVIIKRWLDQISFYDLSIFYDIFILSKIIGRRETNLSEVRSDTVSF